jgi:NADPH-dependent glutamate synthase beta subunit-like oxidoreductase
VKPTETKDPEYYHRVVDCQWACPAHTPVPEYIRLIAAGKYTEAYMVNWESNVFPGILGRTCDRPCEPACRRGRLSDQEEAVAICRLKRVAADYKEDIRPLLPKVPAEKNGRKIALIGAGPASLTVVRDLAPLGYQLDMFDEQNAAGGFMRSQIPAFRLPEKVLDEELGYILGMGINSHFNQRVTSLRSILQRDYDAIFIGSGAPRGRDLPDLPGRQQGAGNIHIGIDWLASVAFGHVSSIGQKVLVLGGGNTAMDCCRTSRRIGGTDVKVVVRSPFKDMKASAWEKDDAMAEDIPIIDNHVPLSFEIANGKLAAMTFDRVEAVYDAAGKRSLVSTGEAPVRFECTDVIIAIGQENAFPWVERDLDIEFDQWDMPRLDPVTFQSTNPRVFFGGDAAFGPENIITAVAHGHQAAVSINLLCSGENIAGRPPPRTTTISQKMGLHEWIYDSQVSDDQRFPVPHASKEKTLRNRLLEVELGFEARQAFNEAQRCLNCDAQTVFTEIRCIECDACVDVCPTDCLTFTGNAEEDELRQKLTMVAKNCDQPLFVSQELPTRRVLVKDENLCLHCGLCAERCPTAAWDMQKFLYNVSLAELQ